MLGPDLVQESDMAMHRTDEGHCDHRRWHGHVRTSVQARDKQRIVEVTV
jgi:hypothetical protein